MATLKKSLVFVTAFAGAMLMGCSDNAVSVDEDYSDGTSAALFKIAAGTNTPFAKIADSASLTISAADMDDFVKELTITDSTVEGSITGIPAGKSRLFTVAVYDSLDSLQYQGTATADLPRGTTVNVPITLYRVGAGAIINGSVVEVGGQIPSDGLLLYLPLNGDTKDYCGNGTDGSATRVTFTTDRLGNPSSAILLDSGYVKIPSGSALDSIDTALTLCAWVNVDNAAVFTGPNSQDGPHIISKGATYGGFWADYAMELHPSSLIPTLETCNISGSARYVAATDAITRDSWHHIAMVYSTGAVSIYIDGILNKTGTMSGNIRKSAQPLFIGVRYETTNITPTWFKGKIDDVLIYRRALSASEIGAIFEIPG